MQKTLEYKILKHLSENDNGKPIDVSSLSENNSLLKQKLSELKSSNYIYYKSSTSVRVSNKPPRILPVPKCKIKLEGSKFLFEISKLQDKSTTNNIYDSQIGQFVQDSELSNKDVNIDINKYDKQKPIKKTIIARFLSLISENKLISGLILGVVFEESVFGYLINLLKSLTQ